MPPKTTAANTDSVHGAAVSNVVSLVAGMFSYYIFHYLSGVMGEWVWPKSLMAIARLYKPITMPVMDMLILGIPMALAYAVTSFCWSRFIGRSARSTAFSFCCGWLVPAVVILCYGEYTEPGVFLSAWAEWPHLAVLMFVPLFGIWQGFRLSSKWS